MLIYTEMARSEIESTALGSRQPATHGICLKRTVNKKWIFLETTEYFA